MKFTEHRPIRFLIAGSVNTSASYLVYVLALKYLPYAIAYTVSFLSGIICSYVLNSIFVFKTAITPRSAMEFPLVYAAQYFGGLVGMYFLVTVAGVNRYIAPFIVLAVSVPLNYIMTRYVLVLRPREKRR